MFTNLFMMSPYQAYAGFQVMEGSSGSPVAVATGNWGCGAFKGDSRLKVFIFLYSPFDIWLISLVLNCLYIAFYTNINIYQLWSWFLHLAFSSSVTYSAGCVWLHWQRCCLFYIWGSETEERPIHNAHLPYRE